MPSTCSLNSCVALESNFNGESFSDFEAGIQRQNAIFWRELMRISKDNCITRTRLWIQHQLPL